MKRKTSATPTRIWCYGLPFGPTRDTQALVEAQMRLARGYKNKLLEILLESRKRYRAARAEHCPEFVAAKAECERLTAQIVEARSSVSRGRQASRRRDKDAAANAAIKALLAERRQAHARLREASAKTKGSEALKAEAAAIEAWKVDATKAARAEFVEKGLYWGTYLLVDKAHEQTSASKTDPPFRRWNGQGRIGVQLQGGLSAQEAMGCNDTRLRIEPPTDLGTGSRRDGQRTTVHIRVGSTQKREPVWASFKCVLHRPLPPDAQIKWAWVQRFPIATRYRWGLCIAMESESFASPARIPEHRAGIDIGWRRMRDGGLRVAYLVGTDGQVEELRVPDGIMGRLEHADSLRAIRDRNFDAIKPTFLAWIQAQQTLPEWFAEEVRYFDRWKASQKLDRLVQRWRDNRFDGDAEIFETMRAWAKQWRHLYDWECSERVRALGHRNEFYRLWALKVAKRYSQITIEKFDLRDMARRRPPEDKHQESEEAQRWQRFVAALSELRGALTLMALNNGTKIVEAPAAYTTMNCHVCGHENRWDAEAELRRTCEACQSEWDQDENAARNLLAFDPERASGDAPEESQGLIADQESEAVTDGYGEDEGGNRMVAAPRTR